MGDLQLLTETSRTFCTRSSFKSLPKSRKHEECGKPIKDVIMRYFPREDRSGACDGAAADRVISGARGPRRGQGTVLIRGGVS